MAPETIEKIQTLIDTSEKTGLPAPVWFIELFKALGFTLHAVPMNLWYAGIITAMILYLKGSDQGRRFSARLMTQMPIIIAMGINLGIVPLLFIQVGFSQIFYPATILMAWFWFLIVVLLTPAYYGVYVYAFGLAEKIAEMPRWKRAVGWTAAGLFISIGFIFANAMSLIENIGGWVALWQSHSVDGAATGTALNIADPSLWPRWLLMFGLALTTTAAWCVVDSAWFATRDTSEYRQWTKQFALRLYTIGAGWFAVAGALYLLTWSSAAWGTMFLSLWTPVTLLTIAAPAGVWYLLWKAQKAEGEIDRLTASYIGLAQFGVLALNAVSRQVVQHVEVAKFYNITQQSTDPQWAPMVIFLLSFVAALGVIVWMLYEVVKVSSSAAAETEARPLTDNLR